MRDTVLWDLAQGRGDTTVVAARLADVVRCAPDGRVAPAATVLSIQHWTAGDGARANVALDRALSETPDYSLGGLVKTSLTTGMPPSTWRDLMRTVPRDVCRTGNTRPSPTPVAEVSGPAVVPANSLAS